MLHDVDRDPGRPVTDHTQRPIRAAVVDDHHLEWIAGGLHLLLKRAKQLRQVPLFVEGRKGKEDFDGSVSGKIQLERL